MPTSSVYGYFRRRTGSKKVGGRRSFKSKGSYKAMQLFRQTKSVKRRRQVRVAKGRRSTKRSGGGFIQRHRGGRVNRVGPRGTAKRAQKVRKLYLGSGKGGPRDTYAPAGQTFPVICQPGKVHTHFNRLWGGGLQIAEMLSQVRTESPYTLVGGAYLYQPTLLVSGYCDFYIYPAGVSDINFEYVLWTSRTGTDNAISASGLIRYL